VAGGDGPAAQDLVSRTGKLVEGVVGGAGPAAQDLVSRTG